MKLIKKQKLHYLLLILVHTALLANVRAPFVQEGMSTHLNSVEKNIVLSAEELRIIYPRIEVNKTPVQGFKLAVEARYIIQNLSEKDITLPLSFLGTQVNAEEVSIDGKIIKSRNHISDMEYSTFTKKITKEYNNLGLTQEKAQEIGYIFKWGKKQFTQIHFEVDMPPGEHTLIVRYLQPMLVNEHTSGYFKRFFYESASYGMLYLIYPIQSWHIAEDFRCIITVAVPRPIKKTFFIQSEKQTTLESNTEFKKQYSDILKMDMYRAELTKKQLPEILYLTVKMQ